MCSRVLSALNLRAHIRRHLSFEAKRRWTISLVFVANFLGGTEFAIILPTVWQYLQSLGVHDETYMGYVTSAFSFSGMFSGLVLGRLADATENIRMIALVVNFFQIIGQFLYFVGNSAYILIFGRFLNGIGVGMNSALYADVIRGTKTSERSRVLTGIFMTRQISIMLAPAYNVLLRLIPNFSYEVEMFGIPVKIRLDELSASGFVVCILWIVFEIALFLFYFNIAEEMKLKRRADRRKKRQEAKLAKWLGRRASADERLPLISSQSTYVDAQPVAAAVAVNDALHQRLQHEDGGVDSGEGELLSGDFQGKSGAGSKRGSVDSWLSAPPGTGCGAGDADADDDEDADNDDDDGGEGRKRSAADEEALKAVRAEFHRSQRVVLAAAVAGRRGTYGSSSDDSALTGRGFFSSEQTRSSEEMKNALQGLSHSEERAKADMRLYMKEFFRPEIIALLFMQMTSLFVQTMIETIVPPLLQEYFGYGTIENSYFFMACGIEFVLVYIILLVVLGKKENISCSVSERIALLTSSALLVTAMVGFVVVGQFLEPGRPELLYAFAAANMVLFIAVPTSSVSSVALIAHVLDARAQGLGQGIRRFCTFVGIIFGPLWGGSMIFHPSALYGGAMSLTLVAFVLVLGSYRHFDITRGVRVDAQNAKNPKGDDGSRS